MFWNVEFVMCNSLEIYVGTQSWISVLSHSDSVIESTVLLVIMLGLLRQVIWTKSSIHLLFLPFFFVFPNHKNRLLDFSLGNSKKLGFTHLGANCGAEPTVNQGLASVVLACLQPSCVEWTSVLSTFISSQTESLGQWLNGKLLWLERSLGQLSAMFFLAWSWSLGVRKT